MSDTKKLEKNWLPNKEEMKDVRDRPLTQSLFLEFQYDTEKAIYTLKGYDHEYNGKLYPSLRKLYLELNDPTEYSFATTYLIDWNHWVRLCDNKFIRKHIDEWRLELEIKIRAEATKHIMVNARKGSFQASKWLADKGWDVRTAGRPSKEQVEREAKVQASIKNDFDDDFERMGKVIAIK